MKRNTDSLFRLIKSMSKSEKRYFKLHSASFKKESYLVKLYDIVERSKKYEDEKLFLKEFKSVCKGKDFYGTKKKLYEQLIRSLRIYNSSANPEARVNTYIENSKILFQKRLIEECNVELHRAITLADSFELFLPLLQALEFESRVNLGKEINSGSKEILLKRESTKEDSLNKYNNYNKYLFLASSFVSLHAKHQFIREAEVEKEYDVIMNDPLLKEDRFALSVRARIMRDNIFCGYYYAKCDFEKSYLYACRMADEIESHPGFDRIFQLTYLIALGNAAKSLLHLKRHSGVDTLIDKLKGIEAYDNATSVKILELKSSIGVALLVDRGEFKAALAMIRKLEEKFGSYFIRSGGSFQYSIMYNAVCAHFGIGNFSGALRWLNKLLITPGIKNNETFYYFAQVLNLIIHYEKSNVEHIEYKVKGIYRYLYGRKNSYKFETLILLLLKESLCVSDPKKLILLFRNFKPKLEEILKDPFEKIAIEYFDIISWLESKIEKRPFEEILREKLKN